MQEDIVRLPQIVVENNGDGSSNPVAIQLSDEARLYPNGKLTELLGKIYSLADQFWQEIDLTGPESGEWVIKDLSL